MQHANHIKHVPNSSQYIPLQPLCSSTTYNWLAIHIMCMEGQEFDCHECDCISHIHHRHTKLCNKHVTNPLQINNIGIITSD